MDKGCIVENDVGKKCVQDDFIVVRVFDALRGICAPFDVFLWPDIDIKVERHTAHSISGWLGQYPWVSNSTPCFIVLFVYASLHLLCSCWHSTLEPTNL